MTEPSPRPLSEDKPGSSKAPEPTTPVNIRHPRKGQAPGSSHSDPGNSDSHESYSGPTDHDLGSSELSSSDVGAGGAQLSSGRNLAGAGSRYIRSYSSSVAYDSEDAGAPVGDGSPTRASDAPRWANSVLRSSSSSSAGSFMANKASLSIFGRPGGAPLGPGNHRLRRQATLVPSNESRGGAAPRSQNNNDGVGHRIVSHDLETPRVSTFAASASLATAPGSTSSSEFLAAPQATATGSGYRSVTHVLPQPRGGFNPQESGRYFSSAATTAQPSRGFNQQENLRQGATHSSSTFSADSTHGYRGTGRHSANRITTGYAGPPAPRRFNHHETDRSVLPAMSPRGFTPQGAGRFATNNTAGATFPVESPRGIIHRESALPFLDGHDATLRNAEKAGIVPRADIAEDDDPQTVYPADACIFVANLAEAKDDEILMATLTREFSRFGTVFVKIRRDEKTGMMPFAFCQFTNKQDADVALTEGRGIMIHGRPCRTERARSSRWFVVFRRDGNRMTLDEARQVMKEYGNVNQVEMHDDQTIRGRSAVKVQFQNFNPQQREIQLMSHHYQVYQVEALTDRRRDNRDDQDMRFLQEYDLARRSIYVSHFPEDSEESELAHHFSVFGRVESVTLVSPPRGYRFAFVEFANAVTVETALAHVTEHLLRGRIMLKVERKMCRAKSARRVGPMRSIESIEVNAPTVTPGRSGGWGRAGPEDFGTAGSHSSMSPQGSMSSSRQTFMYAPRGQSSGGRMPRSPPRVEGGFSVAASRITPGRSTNRTSAHPSATAFDRQPAPPHWPAPLGFAPGVSAPGDAASAFNMSPGGMGAHPHSYIGGDPFTGAPAFTGSAIGTATSGESNAQGGRGNAFNSMLNRLGATGTAEEDVADVEGGVGDKVQTDKA